MRKSADLGKIQMEFTLESKASLGPLAKLVYKYFLKNIIN